jgi:class 3 adenylate cyclase
LKSPKRTKIDIYATILEAIRHFPGGGRITRISYAAGVPLDRMRVMLEDLNSFGLIRKTETEDETTYSISQRGIEFLEAYWKMNAFLEVVKERERAARGLAAIVFADLAGYTSLAQKNELKALKLLEQYQSVVRSAVPTYNGREVKTVGDAFLLEFASTLEAVLCSAEIQRLLLERNRSVGPEDRAYVRIGIHVGDVERRSGDILGDAVNLASRIQSVASPGDICLSRQVYDQVKNKVEFNITKVGPQRLRNVAEPVEIFRLELPAATR